MQTGELVELAALVARQGAAWQAVEVGPAMVGIEDYWAASKCRFDRWGRALHQLRTGGRAELDEGPGTTRGLIEEILGSEVLTRIWTAVVALVDRRRGTQDNEIVARSVYIGHLEMRHRVLKLLVSGAAVSSNDAVALNRLRRRAELWTDMLLASLRTTDDVLEFAFEPERVRQFWDDLRPGGAIERDGCDPKSLLDASLFAAVKSAFSTPSPSSDLNSRIAAAVLGAFPNELFDSHGLSRSLWVVRLAAVADDTQRLVDELFHVEQMTPRSDRRLPESRRFD